MSGEDQLVLTHAKWIVFIFRKLLSNTIKYTPDGGKIKVIFDKSKVGVTLILQDTGIGIPKEDQRRIFDKGFTGENGRTSKQHSMGIGLYLARQLALKLRHQLIMKSFKGEGIRMKLFFPFLRY